MKVKNNKREIFDTIQKRKLESLVDKNGSDESESDEGYHIQGNYLVIDDLKKFTTSSISKITFYITYSSQYKDEIYVPNLNNVGIDRIKVEGVGIFRRMMYNNMNYLATDLLFELSHVNKSRDYNTPIYDRISIEVIYEWHTEYSNKYHSRVFISNSIETSLTDGTKHIDIYFNDAVIIRNYTPS